MIARQVHSLTNKKVMIARAVQSLTGKKKGHDCTNSSFIDQQKNKVMIARKVHSLTTTKKQNMIARHEKIIH